jgi:hypothetical protein
MAKNERTPLVLQAALEKLVADLRAIAEEVEMVSAELEHDDCPPIAFVMNPKAERVLMVAADALKEQAGQSGLLTDHASHLNDIGMKLMRAAGGSLVDNG